jgi:hypothetical protein
VRGALGYTLPLMSTLKMHLAASLLALMLVLLASPPAAGAFGVKSNDPLPANGVLVSSCDAADVDDDAGPSGDGPPESGDFALCVQGPQLSLDASGRIDLARSYQGISPARHLRRGGHSPPRCPP